MTHHVRMTPEQLCCIIEGFFAERRTELHPSGQQTKNGRQFSWCGDVFEFLTEGLSEHLAESGITFTKPYPGPFRLMDEEREADGNHVRRFWTTALDRGCPIGRLCTYFFHRHDQVSLPRPPQVVSFPFNRPEAESRE